MLVLVTGYTFRRPLFHGNFGVVDPARVYRSAQPEKRLEGLIRDCQLKSILNLRGGSPADPFYAEEIALTSREGVDFYDFPMSASRRPTRRELLVLLDLFARCRYPILIHCKSGSDRTGLASALYLMAGRGVGPDRAMRAFTLDYGHVGVFGTERLHEPLVEYAEWLRTRGLIHSPERLRHWVENDYGSDDEDLPTTFRPLRVGPRETVAGKRLADDPGRRNH